MSRGRIVIAIIIAALLAGLMAWQSQRAALLQSCVDNGGIWTGTACRPDPGRIHIQRDLRRT